MQRDLLHRMDLEASSLPASSDVAMMEAAIINFSTKFLFRSKGQSKKSQIIRRVAAFAAPSRAG